ncbi:MAG TPA: hypothetical protein VLA34_12385 [Candidatus Krumholzibacterium sp.]|nr:hypothetical protein [Candidatus Krumholzibacterium sp.]
MRLSTHYYAISLSEQTNALMEAFRDTIIDIRNGGFPVVPSSLIRRNIGPGSRSEELCTMLRVVDRLFAVCYSHDPLGLVVCGEKELLDLFDSLTVHGDVIVGRIEGDYSATSPHDLGKIVWPVVREAISGHLDDVMQNIENASREDRTVCGLTAVSGSGRLEKGSTLLVEDDYHIRGGLQKTPESVKITPDVDVMGEIDDAVDAVIERMLAAGGNVVFTPGGSLKEYERIVLICACF